MSINSQGFDQWIRTDFIQMNTELETLYFDQADDKARVSGIGDSTKAQLTEEGRLFIARLLAEGNTDEGFDAGFDLLGNVGFYMAACRRHEITEPSRESSSPLIEASALALQLGASLGVTPRFATAHLTTHNKAVNGISKSFTSLKDEYIFNDFNNRSIVAFKRAADALFRILPLGISHPVAYDLLVAAKNALNDVVANNSTLHEKLDVDRFFLCVRPYYKPYRVGQHIYRGANAGDFSGINIIDMLLGLCRADNSYYSQLLVDKILYMMPEDQDRLKDCMRRKSLLAELLETPKKQQRSDWYQLHAKLFLEVCDAHGKTAQQHHDQLVKKFIARPADHINQEHMDNLTASGPPLPVLLKSLEKLRDLRLAADSKDIETSFKEIQKLKASIKV